MNRLNDIGLLIFRVSLSSFMMFGHGLGKFKRLIGGEEVEFFDPFGIGATASLAFAVAAEFFAAGLIILGLFTRLSTISLIITMFVAGFIYHAEDPFGTKEKALMFLVSYILLFFTGAGRYSLRRLFQKRIDNLSGIKKFLLS